MDMDLDLCSLWPCICCSHYFAPFCNMSSGSQGLTLMFKSKYYSNQTHRSGIFHVQSMFFPHDIEFLLMLHVHAHVVNFRQKKGVQ